jgi:hypothetical protein
MREEDACRLWVPIKLKHHFPSAARVIHVAMAARDGLKLANPVTNSGGSALQQGAELGGDVSEVGSSHLVAR